MMGPEKKSMYPNVYTELHRSIYLGHFEKFNTIINSLKPPNCLSWEESQQLLSQAISCKRLEIAKILIERECQLKGELECYMRVYPQIVDIGEIELLRFLLDMTLESINKSQNGDTILHVATSKGSEEIIKYIMQRGGDLNLQDRKGMFPLNIAAKRGNVNILKLLLGTGASVDCKSLHEGKTSLMFAVESSNVGVVSLLLKHGADCNDESLKGVSILHAAVSRTNFEITKMLIAAGADLNSRNSIGQTPLHVSCLLRKMNITALLLDAGADINATDNNELVPFDLLSHPVPTSSWAIIGVPPLIFVKEVIKLTEAGLYVHPKNKSKFDKFMELFYKEMVGLDGFHWPKNETLHKIVDDCKNQVGVMKRIETGSGVSLLESLQMLQQPLRTATGKELDLLTLLVQEETLPMYTGLLNSFLKQAKVRKALISQAQTCLNSLINLSHKYLPVLPEEMVINIISYLTNNELKNLVD